MPAHDEFGRALESWRRLLRRVRGLVRSFLDFGTFVQVYAAAVERTRLASTIAEGEMRASDKHLRRCTRTLRCVGSDDEGSCKKRGSRQGSTCVSSLSPRQTDAPPREAEYVVTHDHYSSNQDTAALEPTGRGTERPHPHDDRKKRLQPPDQLLQWLFPRSSEQDRRRAFERHAICGGEIHGLITPDAAVAIIRDAGKDVPAERVWRWCCKRSSGKIHEEEVPLGALRGGRLLGFQEFVELCQGLKEYVKDASLLSGDDSGSQIING